MLVKENKTLREINSKLLEEINLLKERLNLNSTNSSLPPSRDLYRQKGKDRSTTGRKPGGQPGHQGHSYQAMKADKIIDLYPSICSCGEKVEIGSTYTREQKIEIPAIKPYVTEYRRWHGKCSCCQKKNIAPLPQGVSRELLGEHAKTIICALNGFFHNSKRDVQEILQSIFNLPISLGLISNTAQRVSNQLEEKYASIQEEISKSSYLHIDETGHKSKGKRGWAWIFTNKEYSLLKLTSSRGKQVLLDTLGSYDGYVISDRYGAYNYFGAGKRQICWSHLERDFKRFAHSLHPSLSIQGHRLVEIAKEVFGLDKALKKEQIEGDYFLRRIKKLKKELAYIFKSILRIRGTPQAHRVINRLVKSFSMMWLFVKEKVVEMTNNLAERQLRKYVTYRKKLLFTWSVWGNEFVERILSLYLTARLSKSNAFTQLAQCIATNPQ